MWEAWQLAALEDLGLMDTGTGLVNRVAYKLAESPNDTIGTEEFRRTCLSCGVDPDSFTNWAEQRNSARRSEQDRRAPFCRVCVRPGRAARTRSGTAPGNR